MSRPLRKRVDEGVCLSGYSKTSHSPCKAGVADHRRDRSVCCRAGQSTLPPRADDISHVVQPDTAPEESESPASPTPEGWTRGQWVAFTTTFVAYASCYLARNNAAVAKSVLTGPAIGWSSETLGNLDASFLVAYTLGSFTLGSVTDRLGAWPALMGGLLGSGLCQGGLALTGANHGVLPMGALFFSNGLFQSILYPACKKIMGDSFDAGKGRGSALGAWSTCYYIGSIISTALASQLLAAHAAGPDGWRIVFAAPALVLPALALATVPIRLLLDAEPKPAAVSEAAAASETSEAGVRTLFSYPASIWMTSISYALVKCTRYAFLLWLPLYLVTDVHMSFQQAAFTAALFDVGSVAGSLGAGVMSDRLGQQAGLATAMMAPLAALLCTLPMIADAASPAALPLAILALGLCIGGAETLQGAVAPLRYSAPESRAASVGFVNGWGSLGTVLAAPAIPAVAAAAGGIDHAFALLGPLATMAGVLTFLQWALYDAKDDDDTRAIDQ